LHIKAYDTIFGGQKPFIWSPSFKIKSNTLGHVRTHTRKIRG